MSGDDRPTNFATEGTPAQFSRNESLSDLSNVEENSAVIEQFGASKPVENPSYLPRPSSVARSGSSAGSSTNGKDNVNERGNNSRNHKATTPGTYRPSVQDRSGDDSSSNAEEEENLLASFLNSGISKSKSEPLNLKSSAQGKKSKKQAKTITKASNSRPKSKSPRNSGCYTGVIPGVRQTHLKLIPTSPLDASKSPQWDDKKTKMTLPIASNHQMAISDIWADESPNVARGPSIEDEVSNKMPNLAPNGKQLQTDSKIKPTSEQEEIVSYVSSLEETLTASRVLELEANRVAQSMVVSQANEQHYMNIGGHQQPFSMADSVCSNLSGIQPPSVMDSLISISGGNGDFSYLTSNVNSSTSTSVTSNVFTTAKEKEGQNIQSNPSQVAPKPIECRHTLGAKKGNFVPELVRRALGGVSTTQNLNVLGSNTNTITSSYYDDLTSSISSCQSNLDNIQPPTIMDDAIMDNSILSIASISSEIAPTEGMDNSTSSGKFSSMDTTHTIDQSSDTTLKDNKGAVFETPKPITNYCGEDAISEACCTALDDIAPPTLMDDVSGCTKTLVAESHPKVLKSLEERDSDQTYTIQGKFWLGIKFDKHKDLS